MQHFKILVAEDDPLSQEMLKIILSKEGYEVVCVSNGLEALDAVETQKPDLVLMDLQMPVLDGIDTCKRLRIRKNGSERLPIIALTASPSQSNRIKYGEMLFNEILPKPFERKQILEVIASYLTKDGQGQTKHQPTSPEVDKTPLLDWVSAASQFGDDVDAFKDLFNEFLQTLPDRLEQMRQDLQEKNMGELSTKAHNLKGISANFGALALSKLSAQLDKESENGQTLAAEATLQKVSANVETLIKYSRSLFNGNLSVR